MMARSLVIALALFIGINLSADVAAQTTGAAVFGSLAPAENTTILTALSANSAANTAPAPILVAQNAPPAIITPINTAPPTIFFPAPPQAVLPPFDPFGTPARPPGLGSIFPIGTPPPSPSQPAFGNVYSGNFDRFFPETYEAIRRFREATSFSYTHLPRGNRDNGFGMDEIDLRMQLAIPCRFVPNAGQPGFFYVAPGGSLVWWNGPSGEQVPEMSPNGFGSFLDFGVQPRFNESIRLNAWGRVGIFSDFKRVTSNAWRYQGRLEGIVTASPQMEFHLGVIYYGRARVKLLPTAGVVWMPDENWVLRMVFPNPRIERRLWTGVHADWWAYAHMEYGGNSWHINRAERELSGSTDYNDIRLGMGIEFMAQRRIGGFFEFGGSFDREIYFGGRRQASLPSALYLKTGFIF